jgi:hypothetical protein
MADYHGPRLSRRSFLKNTATGAAAIGVLAAVPSSIALRSLPDVPASKNRGSKASSPQLMAYVRDAAKGEIVLMWGTEEVVRTDPGLVARLFEATG